MAEIAPKEIADAKAKLEDQFFPKAGDITDYPSSGGIDITFWPSTIEGPRKCHLVKPAHAPEGYELKSVSMHNNGDRVVMVASFRPE